MFVYKKFQNGTETLLAIADNEIIGKTFSEGILQITVNRDFYCHEMCNEEEALELMRDATSVNAVGAKIIDVMLRKKIVRPEAILTIQGTPHVQIIAV